VSPFPSAVGAWWALTRNSSSKHTRVLCCLHRCCTAHRLHKKIELACTSATLTCSPLCLRAPAHPSLSCPFRPIFETRREDPQCGRFGCGRFEQQILLLNYGGPQPATGCLYNRAKVFNWPHYRLHPCFQEEDGTRGGRHEGGTLDCCYLWPTLLPDSHSHLVLAT